MAYSITRGEVDRLILWMYATPVLSSWTLASTLPFFGLFKADATALSITGDIVFLATSFVALGGLFAVLSLSAKPEHKDSVNQSIRGRVGLVSLYATVWLVGYFLFKQYVV
ncbi:MAG: hypothetical protein AAFQ18_03115 [Pseudomonadota bacterium]